MPFDAEHRLFNPHLGGGALLDLGVYPVTLATRVFGEPDDIASHAYLGETGVDEQAVAIFAYAGGAQAIATSSVRVETGLEACIYGTQGSLRIEPPWYEASRLILSVQGKDSQTLDLPYTGNGYTHEAIEVMRCLHDGLTESPKMTHDDTLRVMRIMDRLRAQWGVK